MLDFKLFIHVSKSPVIIINQLRSFNSRQFKDSHSYPFHTCFPMIASYGLPMLLFTLDDKNLFCCHEWLQHIFATTK